MKKITMPAGVVQANLINKRWTQRQDTGREKHFHHDSTSLAVMASWHDHMDALSVMPSAHRHQCAVALRSMQKPLEAERSARMSCAAVAVLPLLMTFVYSFKRLIAGPTAGAVKI